MTQQDKTKKRQNCMGNIYKEFITLATHVFSLQTHTQISQMNEREKIPEQMYEHAYLF